MPSYDLTEVKANITLSSLFTGDSNELILKSGKQYCLCPFHAEKTPSCSIDDDKGSFKCWGCGASGDCFDYIQLTRGVSQRESFTICAEIANVGSVAPGKAKPRPKPVIKDDGPPALLTPEEREDWARACRTAATDTESSRIAKWRGIRQEAVKWAAEQEIFGIVRYFGERREAFRVSSIHDDNPGQVSWHIRLAALSRGNDSKKNQWHYFPKGKGSWPLIIGDLKEARYIFITEGEWDGLAMISLMGWDKKWPNKLALVTVNGATSFGLLLQYAEFAPHAISFIWPDNDSAGSNWKVKIDANGRQHPSFYDRLKTRLDAAILFQVGNQGNDLNDLIKSGDLRREHVVNATLPHVNKLRQSLPVQVFYRWVCDEKHKDDIETIGACKIVLRDKDRPKGRAQHLSYPKHWYDANIYTRGELEALEGLLDRYIAYRREESNW